MSRYYFHVFNIMAEIAKLWFRLFEQMLNAAPVRIVAEKTLPNGYRPVNIRLRGRIVCMALIAQFRYRLNQVGFRGEDSLPAPVVTEGTVFSRLMYIPKLFRALLRESWRIRIDKLLRELILPQRRNPLEEEGQNIMSLNLIAA
jgi:hypothetical protein